MTAAAPPPARAGWLTLFAPLGERRFRLLWAGLAISLIGDNFQLVALPVLVLDLTGRPGAVGAVLAAEAIPRVALLLGGGLLVDRYGARTVMLASAVQSGAVIALLAVLAGAGAVAAGAPLRPGGRPRGVVRAVPPGCERHHPRPRARRPGPQRQRPAHAGV